MKNYSRTAMLLPFSEYMAKAEVKRNEREPEVNPMDYENVMPKAVIGEVYPDLPSQAAYINRDIQEANQKIVEATKEMFDCVGEEAIKIQLDSLSSHLDDFIMVNDSCAEKEYTFTRKSLIGLSSDIYCRKELAKSMLSLYQLYDRVRDLKHKQEMTKKNILL